MPSTEVVPASGGNGKAKTKPAYVKLTGSYESSLITPPSGRLPASGTWASAERLPIGGVTRLSGVGLVAAMARQSDGQKTCWRGSHDNDDPSGAGRCWTPANTFLLALVAQP